MWTLLPFAPRKENRTLPPQNEMGIGSTVSQLITKTLPIDVEKIRWADNGIASFLSKLLQEWVVNIALDEEELDIHSILRVILENGQSLELFLSEFIEGMREKPASTSHTDLKWYLIGIFWRVWVKVIFDAYSPDIEYSSIEPPVEESSFGALLDIALAGQTENWIFNFSIGTFLDPESVTVYPEAFRDPKNIPLFLLAIQYFMWTLEDRNRSYSPDSPIQILGYHDRVMYITHTTYMILYRHVMSKIYEYIPEYKSMNNDGIAMQIFYNKSVIPLLR